VFTGDFFLTSVNKEKNMTIQKKQIILTTFSLAALLFLLQLFQVSAQVEREGDKATESKAIKEYKNDKGFLERDYGDGIIMVYIPPGKFTMGSFTIGSYEGINHEKPTHDVYLDGYWMGKYEVTLAQYKAFVSETGHQALPSYASKYSPGDNHPVVGISWEDAAAYCKWLSGKLGVRFNFKLPTEAQWEKAARGTDNREYPWGNKVPDKTLANFASNVGKTVPVGSYSGGASPYGLLDMAGNVWEWCQDWYDGKYYHLTASITNPPGPQVGISRVMRGGCWGSGAIFLRCAARYGIAPSFRGIIIGFRLCQDNH
jgi:formylglycine-generating enzyme required for sulfatase activity